MILICWFCSFPFSHLPTHSTIAIVHAIIVSFSFFSFSPSFPAIHLIFRQPYSHSLAHCFITQTNKQTIDSGVLFTFLFPILQCTCFYLAIGDNPKSLKLGIVNEEVPNWHDCYNSSLITAQVRDFECNLSKISCRYLKEIPPELATQVFNFTSSSSLHANVTWPSSELNFTECWVNGNLLSVFSCFHRFISVRKRKPMPKQRKQTSLDTFILHRISRML